jgi:two-component system, NarL family, nitrate/nitrite response regulator NarL
MKQAECKIKVLLADDHQVMIDGLTALLKKEGDIEIVAEANNGIQVLEKLKETTVDIVVLDIGMPEMDGYDTVLKMKQIYPGIKILILSLHNDERNIGKFIREGVAGYIIKDKGSEEIVKAIREIMTGEIYYDKLVMKIFVEMNRNPNVGPNKEINLTEREVHVLCFLAEGMSSKQIGEKLHISESTVDSHKKMQLANLD